MIAKMKKADACIGCQNSTNVRPVGEKLRRFCLLNDDSTPQNATVGQHFLCRTRRTLRLGLLRHRSLSQPPALRSRWAGDTLDAVRLYHKRNLH